MCGSDGKRKLAAIMWSMVACFLCLYITTCNAEANKGLDILKNQMNIRKIRAHFNFRENEAYYMVRFCGRKSQPFCFITNIGEEGRENFDSEETRDVVRKIDLWMKLISTLNGKNDYNIIPANPQKLNDDRCQGNFYSITKGPSKEIMNEILEESKSRPQCKSKKRQVTEPNCQRVCLKGESDTCDEIRLHCQFDGCRCFNKINLQELRKKSKKAQKAKKAKRKSLLS